MEESERIRLIADHQEDVIKRRIRAKKSYYEVASQQYSPEVGLSLWLS